MITSVQSHLPGGFQALVFSPASTDQTAACIVWLHRIGERGSDLSLVAKYGLPAALDQRRSRVNATVLCPQLEPDREGEPARIAELMAHVRMQHAHTALVDFSLGKAPAFCASQASTTAGPPPSSTFANSATCVQTLKK